MWAVKFTGQFFIQDKILYLKPLSWIIVKAVLSDV